MTGRKLTATQLAEDLDTQMQCTALCLVSAAASAYDDATVEQVMQIMERWPENVPEQAQIVGMRVAITLAGLVPIDAEKLGEMAVGVQELIDNEQEASTHDT